MAITVLNNANEQSTYIVLIQFVDEAGNTVVPVTAKWSLRDNSGAIVNGRSAVSIISLATTISIILSTADTSYLANTKISRILTVEAIYNSSTYGNGLQLNDECVFVIQPLTGITNA